MSRSRKSAVEPLAIDECYGCNLCHLTTLHLPSIRRHLFGIHKIIDQESIDTYFEKRRLPVPKLTPASVDGGSTSRVQIPVEPTPKRAKRTKMCNVGCQAKCLDCQRMKARAEELEKLLEDLFQDAEKVKEVLAKQ